MGEMLCLLADHVGEPGYSCLLIRMAYVLTVEKVIKKR